MEPERAIARVLRGAKPVGLAFAVTDRHLATCAHVVNAACERDRRDASVPPEDTVVRLEFPFGGEPNVTPVRTARVTSWLPESGSFDLHDVAILTIDEPLPTGVEILLLASGNLVGPVQMWGPAHPSALGAAHVAGRLMGRTDKTRMQVDQDLHGLFRVRAGFSGGPVWQRSTGRVAGILQASTVVSGGADTYVIAASLVQEALPQLRQIRPGNRSATDASPLSQHLTILHLPGLRFDAEQGLDPERADGAEGLLADLPVGQDGATDGPDLVIATGDLAAHAWPEEYDAAQLFLTHVQRSLGLTEDRIVMVPGRSDVNASMCAAYFLLCEGKRQAPQPPFWPKWEHYAEMFSRFYSREFPADQPWLHTELADLKVVVAGLNSTMWQSHREQSGALGGDQMRWFAERLTSASDRHWLRIAAVHHRPGITGVPRSPVELTDASQFATELGPRLNLVLHAQPGAGVLDTVGSLDVPVIGLQSPPGSLAPDARSYQLLRIGPAAIRVQQRHYDGASGAWAGLDEAGGRKSPYRTHRVKFTDAGAAFPRAGGSADRAVRREQLPAATRGFDDPDRPAGHGGAEVFADHLLARVREVCRLRLPSAMITEVGGAAGNAYLRVGVGHAGAESEQLIGVSQYPIGVCEGTATQSDVQRFLAEVHAQYRASDSTVVSKLVYDGDRAEPGLYEWAAARGVELMSLPEYQLGYDLRPYARRQADELAIDPDYAPGLYVSQRYQEVELLSPPAPDATEHRDLLRRLTTWLSEPQGHLIVVLGAFGHGKTFLLRQLAREMYRLESPAIPVLVQLRELEKTHRLDELVAAQLARGGERRIDLSMFRYLLREGRIALLFDGFEELAVRVSYERAVEHLKTIVQAADGRAKVVLAGRDQYFRTDADVASTLSDRLASVAGRRLVKLLDFNVDQIGAYLAKRLGRERAAERLKLLSDVRELLGLAANPRMLEFITQIDDERLRAARTQEGEINAATLYLEIIKQWLGFEAGRLNANGTAPEFTVDGLLQAVTKLALRLWESGETSLGEEDLSELADTLLAIAPTATEPDAGGEPNRHVATQLVGTHTMLVRNASGRFTFVHRSVMEWLVARNVTDHLTAGNSMPAALTQPISPLIADFIGRLAGPQTAGVWAARVLADARSPQSASANALLIQRGLRVETPVELSGRDLRGQDLTARALRGANLQKADLSEAQLADADLSGANLSHARMVRARADRLKLRAANLQGADLTSARLTGSDLSNADLSGAVLRRAALLNATVSADALANADTHGAALPGSDLPVPQIRSGLPEILTLAVDGRSGLLASAGSDHAISVWDLETGAPIRTLSGHTDWVWSMSFSPDGRWLASVGGDREVRLWDTGSGEHRPALADRAGVLRAVAFAPDSVHLASAGDDRLVRIWNTRDGTVRHQIDGHRQPVWALDFSSDGQFLATGSSDHAVRIWDPHKGKAIRTLNGHTAALRTVVFSPDGKLLASAGGDQVVRIWEASTGRMVGQLAGHAEWVRSAAFSPDGKRLVTAGGDHVVRVWDLASASCDLEIRGHDGWIRSVVHAPDGRSIISAGDDRVIRVWNSTTGASIREVSARTSVLRSVVFSPDGSRMISAGDDRHIQVWDARTGVCRTNIPAGTGVLRTVACSPDGKLLASAGGDRIVQLRRTDDWQPVRELTGHASRIRTLAFAPDGSTLASAGDDRTLRLWQLGEEPTPSVVLQHSDPVWSVAYSPDGRWLASVGSDPVVRLWEPAALTGASAVPRGLTGHRGVLRAIAFAASGDLLASAGSDRAIRLWNPNNGAQLDELAGHSDEVWSVAFSPNGEYLASSGDDRTIRVWNVKARSQVLELAGHTNCVWSVAYSPDGRWLASCGDDGTLRLWDAHTGEAKATLLRLADNGWAVLAGGGTYKMSGTPTGEFWYAVNMCRFEPGELFALDVGLRELPDDARLIA